MTNENRVTDILNYWFGHVEGSVLPSPQLTEIWFAGKAEIDEEIKTKYGEDLNKAIQGEYADWQLKPQSCLALIILLDQFPRHIYRHEARAFAYDQRALDLCLQGIQKEFDHSLSLIERAFYYFPLMHAENLELQATAVRAYQILVNLAFPETRSIYENFLNFAIQHYEIIKRFNRFPYRNELLSRPSSTEEIEYLKTAPNTFGQ